MKNLLARIFLCSLGCHAKGFVTKIYQNRRFFLCPRCGKIMFEFLLDDSRSELDEREEARWNDYTDAYWNGFKR